MNRLIDIAKVLRSKNAGPLQVTFDIMFENKESYKRVINSGVISEDEIARIYGVDKNDVLITKYDIVNSIKITIPRRYISGELLDNDVYGCQQHVPLSDILIP
jgi:hypothetical protein